MQAWIPRRKSGQGVSLLKKDVFLFPLSLLQPCVVKVLHLPGNPELSRESSLRKGAEVKVANQDTLRGDPVVDT